MFVYNDRVFRCKIITLFRSFAYIILIRPSFPVQVKINKEYKIQEIQRIQYTIYTKNTRYNIYKEYKIQEMPIIQYK